jgi:hypothetical protein
MAAQIIHHCIYPQILQLAITDDLYILLCIQNVCDQIDIDLNEKLINQIELLVHLKLSSKEIIKILIKEKFIL